MTVVVELLLAALICLVYLIVISIAWLSWNMGLVGSIAAVMW